MSYDQGMKKHVLSLLATGHRHEFMSDAMKCGYCGTKFAKAKKEVARLQRMHPEKFIRREIDTPDRAMENMGDMLEDRMKRDKLYQRHMWLLAHGTPKEKIREMKREQSGYYTRHTGESSVKIIL